MKSLHYFAYGSNLLHQRLRERTPSARPLGTARIQGFRLTFHKRGDDGSGKCDAWRTGQASDWVWGVVYAVQEKEKHILDAIEGVGFGYELDWIDIQMGRQNLKAFLYFAGVDFVDPNQMPFSWYKNFVVAGAIQNAFPPTYVAQLKAIPAQPDPNRQRDQQNRALFERYADLQRLDYGSR